MFKDGWEAPDKPVQPLIGTGALALSTRTRISGAYTTSTLPVGMLRWAVSWNTLGHPDCWIAATSSSPRTTANYSNEGWWGTYCPLIYDPIVHVPLIISRPGQKGRVDVQAATSSVDLLPTIASLGGGGVPEWAEGQLLPELGGKPDEERGIYAMDAKTNSVYRALTASPWLW